MLLASERGALHVRELLPDDCNPHHVNGFC